MTSHHPDALALANYILELANERGIKLRPLKLMKLTYIAHGFILALLGRSALNPRFDRVEAWRYGPVIPSVYHSFKIYGHDPITEKTTIFLPKEDGKDFEVFTPELNDEDMRKACKIAFLKFNKFTGGELVDMLHAHGTPWEAYYQEGQNNEIPDSVTCRYYDTVINKLIELQHGSGTAKG